MLCSVRLYYNKTPVRFLLDKLDKQCYTFLSDLHGLIPQIVLPKKYLVQYNIPESLTVNKDLWCINIHDLLNILRKAKLTNLLTWLETTVVPTLHLELQSNLKLEIVQISQSLVNLISKKSGVSLTEAKQSMWRMLNQHLRSNKHRYFLHSRYINAKHKNNSVSRLEILARDKKLAAALDALKQIKTELTIA